MSRNPPRRDDTTYWRTGSASSFLASGLSRRHAFDHLIVAFPKQYPDACFLLEGRGMSPTRLRAGRFLQLNLYTRELHDLPDALFEDREVNWHGQQLGRRGLIAAAGLFLAAESATISILQSDLCQQLYRHDALRRSCKTKVETYFKYWYVLLLNAVLDFCAVAGIATLYCPTGEQVVAQTKKRIAPELFLRIYNCPPRRYRCTKVGLGGAEYWEIPVDQNRDRLVPLAPAEPPPIEEEPLVCVLHDVEENIDTAISPAECAENLTRMLRMEKEQGADATYNILGCLLDRKRGEIWDSNERHSIGFHSYDHVTTDCRQLDRCREADLRVRGYRPPQSKITAELTDYNLSRLNFEWLASSAGSLGQSRCVLQNGIAKIPIHLDDYPLFTNQMDYETWEAALFERAQAAGFLAVGLHDCYGKHWLARYPRLLEKLQTFGRLVTADYVCDRIFLRGSCEPVGDGGSARQAPCSELGNEHHKSRPQRLLQAIGGRLWPVRKSLPGSRP